MGNESIGKFVDWFIPPALRADAELLRRARMYLVGHIFGTPFGVLVAGYLYFFVDPAPDFAYWIILTLISTLFVYPVLVKFGVPYTALAFASVQHLTIIILYGSYNYGGVYSPFLAWILSVPVLALYYLGPRLRLPMLGLLALFMFGFYLVYALGFSFPERVSLADLGGVGLFSTFCAACFVSMMCLYYASIFSAQQKRLEREIDRHLATETMLREAKDEAEKANRSKSEFLAKMSHELRTPLNAIIGFSQIIAGQLFGPVGTPKYISYSNDIERSGQHLLQLIGEILDLAKIETGKLSLDEADVDLGELVREAIDLVRPQSAASGVALTVEHDGANLLLRADPLRLKQILLNLLSNALKFTDRGGTVRIDVADSASGGIDLRLIDNGIGIAAADIERVMLPFEQVGGAMARNTGGTGLGLPLAREFAMLHDGTLTLTSRFGAGTTATLSLPAARVVDRPAMQSKTAKQEVLAAAD